MSTSNAAERSYRELVAFFGWTLGLTGLAFWGPLAVLRIPAATAGGQASAGVGLLLFILGGFVPSLVGIALTVRTEGREGIGRLVRRAVAFRFPVRWYLAILLFPLLVGGARLLVSWLEGYPIQAAEPLASMLSNPALWIAFAIQILVLGPLSEEFGWRGYAQERLLALFSPLSGSLLLGVIWAVWHLPLFFIPGTSQSEGTQPVLQFLLFSVLVISITIIMTWLYHQTGRSLGAIILMHTAFNFVGTVVSFLVVPSMLDSAVQAIGFLIVAAGGVVLGGSRLGVDKGAGPIRLSPHL